MHLRLPWRDEYVRRVNDDALSNGRVSDELFTKLRSGNDSSWQSNLRRESGTKLQADTGKSQDKQSRILGENADNRGLTSKYASPEEAKASGKVSDADPKVEGNKPKVVKALDGSPEAEKTADILNKLVAKSYEMTKDHPINLKRIEEGEAPANIIIPRGDSRRSSRCICLSM